MIRLIRFTYEASDEGTPGMMFVNGFHCFTLELPWRDNKRSISCIPPGRYPVRLGQSVNPLGGRRDLYMIHDVPGRSEIFIHAGNWAGDVSKGYKSNSEGCPLLGMTKVDRGMIGDSRKAVEQFMDHMNDTVIEVINT